MLDAVRQVLEEGSRFLLTTHVNPDGDGIGAQLALLRFLRERGKEARVLNPGPHEDRLDFLVAEGEPVGVYDPEAHGEWLGGVDTLLLLDVNSLSRLGAVAGVVRGTSARVVCIDHHHPGEDAFDLTWVREDACATGQLLFELLEAEDALTPDKADPLYVSLVTDTGSFRFARTTPEVHRMAARLLELGVQPQAIHERLYEGLSLGSVLLTGDILSGMGSACDGKVAWQAVTRSMLEERGADLDDVGDVVNYTIALEGVEVGVLFRELGPSLTKASLRSKGRLDVHDFARSLGGGGHRHAAGIVLDQPLDRARNRILDALCEALQSLGAS